MPKIQDYSSKADIGSPIQTRQMTSVDGGLGDSIQKVGEAVSGLGERIQKRDEQDDTLDVSTKLSQLHADSTMDLEKRLTDPNANPNTVYQDFIEKFDERVGSIMDGTQTRAGQMYAQKMSAELRTHFQEAAFRGKASLAGEQAISNHQTVVNSLSSSLINDPSALENVRKLYDEHMNQLIQTQTLPGEAAIKLRMQDTPSLVDAAVKGYINNGNPAYAKEQLESGRWDSLIDGDQKAKLIGQADQGIRGIELEKKRQQQEIDDKRTEAQKAEQNKFLIKLEAGTLSSKEVLSSSALDAFGSGSKETFLRLIEGRTKGEAKTNPQVQNDLLARIHLPDGDPRKITDARQLIPFIGKGLGYTGINQLRKEIEGLNTPEGRREAQFRNSVLREAKGFLVKADPMKGITDPAGERRFAQFQEWMNTTIDEAKASGKGTAHLFTPSSPDYLGNGVRLFAAKGDEAFKAMTEGSDYTPPPYPAAATSTAPGASSGAAARPPTSNVLQRKPDETIEEWKARTKGAK